MGSIALCGSQEQQERWLPAMARMELLGAFGLTEPEVGSGIAGGLATTARRDADEWILDGQKKWIGNASFADLVVIWARDVEDAQVKGFVVEKGTEGMTFDVQRDKMALRVVLNAEIELTGVRVAEDNRLADAHSFKDTAKVLKVTRMGVAWAATGCVRGAYEHALAYTKDAGLLRDEHASLAKAFTTARIRETVGWAREVLGGNGILLEHHVGRVVADAEAIYSYEGTREINTLIVGRAITGTGAFV